MKFHSSQSGFSLVETLVAISILLIALVGPLTIASRGLQSSLYAREQVTATFLAQEGVELVMKIRDENGLAYAGGGSDAWDWVAGGTYAACFASNGCGLAIADDGGVSVAGCGSEGAGCELRIQESGRDRYNYSSGEPTPYTRVIQLTTPSANAVKITSTVSWRGGLLGDSSVSVSNFVYDVY